MKIYDNGRTIATAKIKVCSICGYRKDEGHCPGHINLRIGLQGEREIYAVDYVPPPYVRERAGKGKKRAPKPELPAVLFEA